MEKAEIKEILRKSSVEVDIQGHGKVLCLFESDIIDHCGLKYCVGCNEHFDE